MPALAALLLAATVATVASVASVATVAPVASGRQAPASRASSAVMPCAPRRGAGDQVVVASLALERTVARADTLLSVIVCLRPGTRAEPIGSYHGEMRYDTSTARLVGVDHLAGGAQQENTADRGRIRFAGAAPGGADTAGSLLRVRLRMLAPGRIPWVDLAMLEVNSTQGAALITRVQVSGLPEGPAVPVGGFSWEAQERGGERSTPAGPQARLRAPVVHSMTPARIVDRGQGAAHVVTIRGRYFTADDNVVLYGSIRITNVRSTKGGTVLQFTVPTEVVTGGEAPPPPVGPGSYKVRVQTRGGTSRALVFQLVQG